MKSNFISYLTVALLAALSLTGCKKTDFSVQTPPEIGFENGTGIYTATRGQEVTITAIVANATEDTQYTWLAPGSDPQEFVEVGQGTSYRFTATTAGDNYLRFRASNKNGTAQENVIIKVYYPAPEVYEFRPAPGQFVNEGYTATTAQEACQYARDAMKEYGYVSLGGFGGYIVVGFGSGNSIVTRSGSADVYDFAILGNSYKGSSEPGIVWVMEDTNDNGKPDDTWYQLKGSEHDADGTEHDYWVRYTRPANDTDPVSWEDSRGETGVIHRVDRHTQPYYPRWISEPTYTLHGTCLGLRHSYDPATGFWTNAEYGWGYADNFEADGRKDDNKPMANYFRISDAVDTHGAPATLNKIDFIKVQTGVNGTSGALGEISTEVCGFIDLSKE